MSRFSFIIEIYGVVPAVLPLPHAYFPFFFAQNIPMVNIIESVCGVERFVTAVDCTSKANNMLFLAD